MSVVSDEELKCKQKQIFLISEDILRYHCLRYRELTIYIFQFVILGCMDKTVEQHVETAEITQSVTQCLVSVKMAVRWATRVAFVKIVSSLC